MSYILEALKKDKAASQPTSTIYTEQPIAARDGRSNKAGIAWGVLLTMAILGAVLLGYFLGRGQLSHPMPNNVTSNASLTSNNIESSPVQREQSQSLHEKEALKTEKQTQPIAKIAAESYFNNPPPKQSSTRVEQGNVVTEIELPATEAAAVTEQNKSTVDPTVFKVEAEDGVSDALLQMVQNAIDETHSGEDIKESGSGSNDVDYSQVQPLASMSQNVQNAVPSLDFTMHIYSTTDEGWVRVNGNDVREGETVAPNIKLLKIEPQRVILQSKDVLFSLPAMSTW